MRHTIPNFFVTGSSPRVWGTQFMQQSKNTIRRFIPTCVGNTGRGRGRSRPAPVHPHVCGEHTNPITSAITAIGSSPRVWGTRLPHRHALLLERFIPTCVGNTMPPPRQHTHRRVHPHVCGEHDPCASGSVLDCGSSPRVWGTQGVRGYVHLVHRFIPTCVGNTPAGSGRTALIAVHPHVCGEHTLFRL